MFIQKRAHLKSSSIQWFVSKTLFECKLGKFDNKITLVEFYCIPWQTKFLIAQRLNDASKLCPTMFVINVCSKIYTNIGGRKCCISCKKNCIKEWCPSQFNSHLSKYNLWSAVQRRFLFQMSCFMYIFDLLHYMIGRYILSSIPIS